MYIDAILLTVAEACEANTGVIFPELKIGRTNDTYIQNQETKEEFWINGVADFGVFTYQGPFEGTGLELTAEEVLSVAADTVTLFEAECPSIYFRDVVPKAASQAFMVMESTGCVRCSS